MYYLHIERLEVSKFPLCLSPDFAYFLSSSYGVHGCISRSRVVIHNAVNDKDYSISA